MSLFGRRRSQRVHTVMDPKVAVRLEQVTDRLEQMVQALQDRLEQFHGEEPDA